MLNLSTSLLGSFEVAPSERPSHLVELTQELLACFYAVSQNRQQFIKRVA